MGCGAKMNTRYPTTGSERLLGPQTQITSDRLHPQLILCWPMRWPSSDKLARQKMVECVPPSNMAAGLGGVIPGYFGTVLCTPCLANFSQDYERLLLPPTHDLTGKSMHLLVSNIDKNFSRFLASPSNWCRRWRKQRTERQFRPQVA